LSFPSKLAALLEKRVDPSKLQATVLDQSANMGLRQMAQEILKTIRAGIDLGALVRFRPEAEQAPAFHHNPPQIGKNNLKKAYFDSCTCGGLESLYSYSGCKKN
jgi:hypothetical protein